MRASIIIAAHNEGPSLWKTIRSCVESIGKLDFEILIADDASDDGSVEEAMRRFPHLSVHQHKQREGASPTKHMGASNARGEVLIFLDGHCHPEPAAIQRLVENVERLDGQSIVTPTILALDTARWKNKESQVGHGYRLEVYGKSAVPAASSTNRPPPSVAPLPCTASCMTTCVASTLTCGSGAWKIWISASSAG